MEKQCTKCGEIKDIEGFCKNGSAKDGHVSKCKKCAASYMMAYRKANPKKTKAGRKAYASSEKGRMAMRRHALSEKGILTRRIRMKNKGWCKIKGFAKQEVRAAIRDNKLKREPCEVFGKLPTDGHHDDYSKPLDVRWLCRLHHSEHHMKMRNA